MTRKLGLLENNISSGFIPTFRPTFERGKQFHNGAIAIKKEKYRINFNKPIYMEKSILDLSKALMQDFDYDYIKNKHGDKAEMLLTDTDTLMYKLKLKIFLRAFTKIESYLNFSNYPKDSKYYNNSDRVVVSKLKEEICGVPIKDLVGFKSKIYLST